MANESSLNGLFLVLPKTILQQRISETVTLNSLWQELSFFFSIGHTETYYCYSSMDHWSATVAERSSHYFLNPCSATTFDGFRFIL